MIDKFVFLLPIFPVKDLVKSHLMFAVREEVEVLKEKITELVDRISELEYENGILRAHANSETLALVQTAKSVRMSSSASQGGAPQQGQQQNAAEAQATPSAQLSVAAVVAAQQQYQQQQQPSQTVASAL